MAGAPQPSIPSITGNPALDSVLAAAIIAGSTALTTWLVAWLNLHQITDPNLPTMVGGIVLMTMIGVATAAWRFVVAHQIPKVIEAVQVQAANATLSMVAKGEMQTLNTGLLPPLPVPVTPGSVKAIVSTYGTGDGTVKT